MPGCIHKFQTLMGANYPLLGMDARGEAVTNAETLSIMHDYEIGGASTADFVDAILPLCKAGTAPEDIVDAWNTMHDGIPAERIEAVRKLAAHYPLYLLSNNNEAHWADVNAQYPELVACFRHCFLSHQLHLGKPDPRIFEVVDACLAKEDEAYNPAHTIFVDDLEANCQAARRHGWQACLSVEELLSLLNQ